MQRRYADLQVRRSYPYFVLEFDRLQPVFEGIIVTSNELPFMNWYTHKGQQVGKEWVPLVQKYVDDWILATELAVEEMHTLHTDKAYLDYLRWFLPRTRARVSFTLVEP
uniref:Uncharacterized protein n=1 Tax=Leersia perrieri TaxID=77586 RepID=A0A0D9XE58_9ORYZ